MRSRPILFVDDSPVARVATTRLLDAQGIEITVLTSFREAFAVDPAGFSAALLDIELGDGLGTELALRLRERAPTLHIAFLSAGAPAEVLALARPIGPVFSKQDAMEDAVRWVVAAVHGALD